MFDNLLYQNVSDLLSSDIYNDRFPGSILLSGPDSSGKLTAALEIARILSCKEKGEWACKCSSCLKHKALTNTNLLLAGPRDCSLEIAASQKAFLHSAQSKDSHLVATRYLFIRSVRKLILRFNPILYQGDDKLSKISSYTSTINEYLDSYTHDIQAIHVCIDNPTIGSSSRFIPVNNDVRKTIWYKEAVRTEGNAKWYYLYDEVNFEYYHMKKQASREFLQKC